jgi:hypothetical protein
MNLCADVLEHLNARITDLYGEETARKCSETSVRKIQNPKNHPKERIEHSEHYVSLKKKNNLLLFGDQLTFSYL